MKNVEALIAEFHELLNLQNFEEDKLDYRLIDTHKLMLQQLARVNNCGVSVFDLYRKDHVFVSYNFESLFGYDMDEVEKQNTEYFNSRIHPDDILPLMLNGNELIRFIYTLPESERAEYKLITEYRVLGADNTFVRIVEQHQALELDCKGNFWLALSIMDVSPNQDVMHGIHSQLINFRTGKIMLLPAAKDNTMVSLTNREKEILRMVKEGYLSKEISDKLSISLHTVNTHRQRILEKLSADNSMEAVGYASKLGLIE